MKKLLKSSGLLLLISSSAFAAPGPNLAKEISSAVVQQLPAQIQVLNVQQMADVFVPCIAPDGQISYASEVYAVTLSISYAKVDCVAYICDANPSPQLMNCRSSAVVNSTQPN
jgi:predicted secreted protein